MASTAGVAGQRVTGRRQWAAAPVRGQDDASASRCSPVSSAQPATARSSSCVEQLAVERLPLGGALHLDELAAAGADHVHVGLGRDVLVVAQVEPGLAVDDADADRRDRGGQRRRPWSASCPRSQRDRVGQRDVGAGDGRGPGAAVGLEHVAVEHDRVLAERLQVDAGPQRPADQPGDLVGAAADAALDRLAVAAGVGGPRQHRVLGGDPAQAAAPCASAARPRCTLAAHSTRVPPNSTSTEPSACSSQFLVIVTSRS